MSEAYVERILKARVYDVAIESPLDPMPRLSAALLRSAAQRERQAAVSRSAECAYNKIATSERQRVVEMRSAAITPRVGWGRRPAFPRHRER